MGTIGIIAALTLVLLSMLTPASADAHPLGNFTINRYARLEFSEDTVSIIYALDFAEIPTFQQMQLLDTDDDGFVNQAEYDASAKADVSQGAEHAAAHSAVVTRETFMSLDSDKDGRISSTEADADARFDVSFSAMDANGDGFVTDAEFRAHAKATAQPEDKGEHKSP